MKRLIFVVLLLTSFQAYAIPITSTVGDFDVTTITGTLDAVYAQLDDQAGWNNETLAEEFAGLVQDALGIPNSLNLGPLFSYEANDFGGDGSFSDIGDSNRYAAWCGAGNPFSCTGVSTFLSSVVGTGNPSTNVWAVAQPTSVPVSGTLALFGLGFAGLGWSRRKQIS